jgi:glutamate-5-semialdehyde dehydrogenase
MGMTLDALAIDLGSRARAAGDRLAELPGDVRDDALRLAALRLEESRREILAENAKDLEAGQKNGLGAAMLDRLALSDARIAGIAQGVRVAALPDPVGEIAHLAPRPNGLRVGRMRIPLGVILVIYESRPNVTVDVAALCVKSGNAALLRGGSEAVHSNRVLARLFADAARESGLPEHAIQLVPRQDRELVDLLLQREADIDLVIPRGGEELIRRVSEKSRIPVIKHYKGVCHVYLDAFAEPKMAHAIAINAKCQRPSVCNAAETLLVHRALERSLLPGLLRELAGLGVELRGCERTRAVFPDARAASEDDWRAEYLAKILAVRVVDSLDQAVDHIRRYGSNHTDAIVTEDLRTAREFVRRVNSSTVLVNASTRFSDGYELGLGAEVGVSTTRIHAYGPMGLEGLTTQKFIVFGDGQVRE